MNSINLIGLFGRPQLHYMSTSPSKESWLQVRQRSFKQFYKFVDYNAPTQDLDETWSPLGQGHLLISSLDE